MLGLLAAFGASVPYSLGVTLQSSEARLAPEQESLRPALLRRLVLAGEAMTGGAVAAMATAASLITVGVGTAMLAGTRAVGAAISTDA